MRTIFVVGLLIFLVAPAFGQHAASRLQWQPQLSVGGFDPDQRLEQMVELDIVGRSAISTLALLTEHTNVLFEVAPEDLATLGERKLSILVLQPMRLKDIMVQIPTALQEAHWDIDTTGAEPVYLLHRNAGTDSTLAWLSEKEKRRKADADRPARADRVEVARRALAMSPEELAELEKTDLFLARSMMNPETRPFLETFLSLPEDQMEQFLDTGRVEKDYGNLSNQLQQEILTRLQRNHEEAVLSNITDQIALSKILLEGVSGSKLSFNDFGGQPYSDGFGPDFRFGFLVYNKDRSGVICTYDRLLLPKYPGTNDHAMKYGADELANLLAKTGTSDRGTAREQVAEWRDRGVTIKVQEAQASHEKEWREPTDPRLLQPVALKSEARLKFPEIQEILSGETELSIISDYFSAEAQDLPKEAMVAKPLWQQLNTLSEHWDYQWQQVGDYLVFHHTKWFDMMKGELPESLLEACRKKLREQGGRATLEDAAAIVLAHPGIIPEPAVPEDLAKAGLSYRNLLLGSWWLQFYAMLSPDQLATARSAAGLLFENMTMTQQQHVAPQVYFLEEKASKLCFHLTEETDQAGATTYTFSLRMPGEEMPRQSEQLVFPNPVPVQEGD